MPESPRLRAAFLDDIDAVSALLKENELAEAGFRDRFGASYAVLENAEGVVGVAGVEVYGDLGLLRSVAVTPRLHGTGLGGRLVEDRTAWARRRGLRALYLLTEGAGGFFARHGFREVERSRVAPEIRETQEFSRFCPESATVMALELTGG